MTDTERTLRQIRTLLVVIASCAVLAISLAFLVLFMPDTYRWLLTRRTTIALFFGLTMFIVVPIVLTAMVLKRLGASPTPRSDTSGR